MSIGSSSGVAASASGSQLAQTAGSNVERAQQDTAAHERHRAADEQADAAAGVAETDANDLETHDRDADGRRLWEIDPSRRHADSAQTDGPMHGDRREDGVDNRGEYLDLTG
jgi:hypothetical protein